MFLFFFGTFVVLLFDCDGVVVLLWWCFGTRLWSHRPSEHLEEAVERGVEEGPLGKASLVIFRASKMGLKGPLEYN